MILTAVRCYLLLEIHEHVLNKIYIFDSISGISWVHNNCELKWNLSFNSPQIFPIFSH